MSEIDNFEIIKSLLNFESEDNFYFLQIIKRKKENPDLKHSAKIVKTYYINSVEHLEEKKAEIVTLCKLNNARAGISLNRRSYEKVAFHTLRKVTEQICNKDFSSVKRAFDKSCGAYCDGNDKFWIIDLDGEDAEVTIKNKVKIAINNCNPIGVDKFLCEIPTPNGKHLITKPFDISAFNLLMGTPIDIHKNNPTILYYFKNE